ncbi:MAG: type II toxin-antitoxin system PemK/MazF family toxin [bacterium]
MIVAPLSKVHRKGPWHVSLRKGEAGVSQTSIIKCEQITTLRKQIVDEEPLGNAISAAKMRRVERAVLRAIGVPVPE